MDLGLAIRAAAVQAIVVAALFALLVALPLRGGFFRDYGPITGPLAWTAAALVTAAALRLASTRVLVAAVVSGLIAAAVGFTVGHSAGLAVGIVAFGFACGAIVGGRRAAAAK